jgi:hypothetical protein
LLLLLSLAYLLVIVVITYAFFYAGSLPAEGGWKDYQRRGRQLCALEAGCGARKMNARLKASEAEMQKTIDNSSEVITLMRRELNEEIDNYDLLKSGNDTLLEERNTLWYQVVDLESELAKVKMSATENISALEVRLAIVEARAVDDSAAAEKCLVEFHTKLTEDLACLCEAYEGNIQSLACICSPILDAAPSVKDYIRWPTSEVGCLPEVRQKLHFGSDWGRACDGRGC